MKNWMIWVVFAWFIISSLELFGIYNTLREIKADVSKVQYDLNKENQIIIPFTAPIRRK